MYDENVKNQNIGVVKQMLTSPLFLTAAISYSVHALFSLIGGMARGGARSNLLYWLSDQSGLYSENLNYMQAYVSTYNVIWTLWVLIFTVPVVCIAAGIWMTFVSAKDKKRVDMNRTGLSMIRVVVIVQLVLTCVETVFIVIMCMLGILGASSVDSYYSDLGMTLRALMAVAIVFMIAYAVVEILYYVKLGKTINIMKDTLETGRADSRISRYVEIFSYISGGMSAISALISLARISIYGFLSSAALATANICFAMYLGKYRSAMVDLNGYVQQMGYQNVPQQMSYREQQPVYQASQQPVHQNIPPNVSTDTEVLSYYNETSVLSGQMLNNGQTQLVRMTRLRTGETFCISKPNFWIGKDAENVDYCITNNSAISRRHMLVTIQNGQCCVRDNNSTNRVFLNGQALTPQEDVPVSGGDRITLGDEEFIVDVS